MEISKEKSKTMLNSVNINEHVSIVMYGIMFEDVKTFKNLVSTIKYDRSSENEHLI